MGDSLNCFITASTSSPSSEGYRHTFLYSVLLQKSENCEQSICRNWKILRTLHRKTKNLYFYQYFQYQYTIPKSRNHIIDNHQNEQDKKGIVLRVTNSTRYDAVVTVLAEDNRQANRPLGDNAFLQWNEKIKVKAGKAVTYRIRNLNENSSPYK